MKPNDMVISTNDIEHLGNIIFTKGKKYRIMTIYYDSIRLVCNPYEAVKGTGYSDNNEISTSLFENNFIIDKQRKEKLKTILKKS